MTKTPPTPLPGDQFWRARNGTRTHLMRHWNNNLDLSRSWCGVTLLTRTDADWGNGPCAKCLINRAANPPEVVPPQPVSELADAIDKVIQKAMHMASKPHAAFDPDYWDHWRNVSVNKILELVDLDQARIRAAVRAHEARMDESAHLNTPPGLFSDD